MFHVKQQRSCTGFAIHLQESVTSGTAAVRTGTPSHLLQMPSFNDASIAATSGGRRQPEAAGRRPHRGEAAGRRTGTPQSGGQATGGRG